MNKVVVDIASKILVTLGAGAGALLAKAATEKGIGSVIKSIQEKKDTLAEVVETTAENADPAAVTEAMGTVEEVVEKAAEVAEEVSGA